jgi:hypothetical protein
MFSNSSLVANMVLLFIDYQLVMSRKIKIIRPLTVLQIYNLGIEFEKLSIYALQI